jgi:hypothetical protein
MGVVAYVTKNIDIYEINSQNIVQQITYEITSFTKTYRALLGK